MLWQSLCVTVWLARQVHEVMLESARAYDPLETGGLLLGWRDGLDHVVVGILGPGPRALHGRFMFVPDHSWQVEQLRNAFNQSGGDLRYLGDWHTHPRGVAQMSELDEKTLTRIGRKVAGAIMLIAAGHQDNWTLGSWVAGRRRLVGANPACSLDLKKFEPRSSWPQVACF